MDEQWMYEDFTQIKPRRPEGTTVAACCEEWESNMPFSMLWPLGENLNSSAQAGFDVGQLSTVEDSDTLDHEVHAGPDQEDESGSKQLSSEESLGEFEFSCTSTSSSAMVERLCSSGISPADELFFRGQLLPLHLPPRIQMVKKLTLDMQHQPQQELHQSSEPSASVNSDNHGNVDTVELGNLAMSQAKFARLFQPMYNSKGVATPYPNNPNPRPASANAWYDPRELAQEFTGYSSGRASFTSTDRDSSADSSSSRDSSGSSQDCFDSGKENLYSGTGNHDGKGTFLHNREVFSTQSACEQRRSPSGISNWLKPPFKWKVLFGAKKSMSKQSTIPVGLSTTSHPDVDEPQDANQSNEPFNAHQDILFSGIPTSLDCRYYSDCSGELTHSGDLLVSSRAFVHGDGVEQDKYSYQRGMEKAKGYLHRYMKVLQKRASSHGSSTLNPPAVDHANVTPRPPQASRSPAITNTKIFPPFSQSFRFSAKDKVSLRTIKKPPQPPLPNAGRRVSMELHNAIQGAIAHCKESQTREDNAQKL